jgi:pyrroline-5-carboxylate reductase
VPDEDNEVEESASLTPEQRIEQLEQRVGKNRIFLMIVALFIVVGLSVSITAFVFQYLGSDSDAGNDAFVNMQERLDAQAELITIYEGRLAQVNEDFKVLENRVSNNSNATIQGVLVEQEQAKQAFMTAVRAAIYDLAHMVPGSRSWFELYSEQIDIALVASEEREKKLKDLSSGKELEDDGSFF